MVPQAAMGLELPSTASIPATTLALVLFNGFIIHQCRPRSGRLIGPRQLAKGLEALLRNCEAAMRKRIEKLPRGQLELARLLARGHAYWEQQVRKRYLTGHHLRIPGTEAFGCWALPEAVRLQLLRQFAATGPWPLANRLRLVLLSPVTEQLRLLDQVAVYLRAPNPCGPKGRTAEGATGLWMPVPPDHVTASLQADMVVVIVE